MKKIVIALVCLLLVGAVAFWYFKRDSDKARDVLPANATTVMVFEPVELVEELGLSLKDIFQLLSFWGDAENSIDFAKPCYLFNTESGMTGFALNVSDKVNIEKTLTSLGFASEEQRGFTWLTNSSSICCLDDDKMMVCSASATEQDAVRNEIYTLMSQKRQDVPVLDKANGQEGVLRGSTALCNLPKQLALPISPGTDLSEAFLSIALRIEKKAISLSAKLDGVDNLSVPLLPIKGDLTAIEPEEPFAWICVNMKDEELLPYLRKMPEIRTALLGLNLSVDADLMIKAIDGDVAVAIPKVDEHPEFIITAKLKDTDFLANAADWKVNARSKTDFSVTQNEMNVFFGVRDEKLYIASSEQLADKACRKAEAEDYQEEAKGKYLSASLDLEDLIQAVMKRPSAMSMTLMLPQVRSFVNALERLSLTADSPQSLELRIETDEPVKELYANLFSLFTGDKK